MRRTKNGFALLPLVILTAAVIVAAGVFFGIKNKPTFVLQNINEPPAQAQSFGAAGSPAVQGQAFFLAGSGVTSNATTLLLTSFKLSDASTTITIGMFGSGGTGFATLEPGSTREENISFTGVTQNTDGTALLTGVTRGLSFSYPCTSTAALQKAHAGGTKLVLSNSNCFYQQFVTAANDASITARYDFSSSSIPTIPASTTFTNASQIINKNYADSLSFAGAPNGTTSTKGIYQEATTSTIASGTIVGTTGADLALTQATASTTSKAYSVVETNGSGTIDTSFISPSSTYTLGGLSTASATVSGVATLATTTVNGTDVGTSLLKGFGAGTNGVVTQNVSTTLGSDMYYDTLTVATSVTINTGGYRIYVKNTLTVNGTIQNNGSNGSTTAVQAGAPGGLGAPGGTLAAGVQGSNGGAGGNVNGSGVAGQNGSSTTSLGVSGSSGGSGGTGNGSSPAGGGGGTPGTATAENLQLTLRFPSVTLNTGANTVSVAYSFLGSVSSSTLSASAGSSGGGGGGGSAGGQAGLGGGGGGGGGGIVYIAARIIVIGSQGIIQANGGTGGNGGAGASGGGGGGGGGGGPGGVIVMAYISLTNNGLLQALGGAFGTSSGANPGTSGTVGSAGNIYRAIIQ